MTLNKDGVNLPPVEVTASDKAEMKDQMLLTLRTLITMCGTLPAVPRQHFITFKLLYNDDITVRGCWRAMPSHIANFSARQPVNWEPKYFSGAPDNAMPELSADNIHIQMGKLVTVRRPPAAYPSPSLTCTHMSRVPAVPLHVPESVYAKARAER